MNDDDRAWLEWFDNPQARRMRLCARLNDLRNRDIPKDESRIFVIGLFAIWEQWFRG